MEPIEYFRYKLPMWYNAWNGTPTDFSHRDVEGFEHFISVYQNKQMVVLISDATKKKLQDYYDGRREKARTPLLSLSQAGRWYANGFTSAYNFCKQYADRLHGTFDFTPYIEKLGQENEKDVHLHIKVSRDYVINVGRIEGTRFYMEESGNIRNGSEEDRKETAAPMTAEQDATDAQEERNFPALAVAKNLRPASTNQRVLNKVREIIKGSKDKSIVGYCIICLKELGLTDSADDVLKAAFRSDFYPDVEKRVFDTSVNRILRSHRQKDTYSGSDKGERWGTKRETLYQKIYKSLRIAISMG